MSGSNCERRIGVRELNSNASALLREVCESGAEIVVTLRGRPIARIEPIEVDYLAPGLDGMGTSRGKIADWPQLGWDDFVAAKALWQPSSLDE